jgi:hypothetical protein
MFADAPPLRYIRRSLPGVRVPAAIDARIVPIV